MVNQLRILFLLMSKLRDGTKATSAMKKDVGQEFFSRQVLPGPNVSGGVLNGSSAQAVASHTPVSMVTQPLRLLCSPPPH